MKIPPEAKKVFEGVVFDVYQWEQEMFDGTTQTFERIRRADSTQVIAVMGSRVLLLEEEQPASKKTIGIIGGVIDAGETPFESAQRELLEEAGLSSDDWEPLFTAEPGGGKIEYTAHYYVARNCSKVQEPSLDPGEKITVRPVSFEDFVQVATRSDFRSKPLTEYLLRLERDGNLQDFKGILFRSRPARP